MNRWGTYQQAAESQDDIIRDRLFNSARPVWEIGTSGEVMAVVNGKEGEADGIYVYSVNSSKNLMYELPIPVDEAKWPIQISQIKGDIHCYYFLKSSI